MTDNRNQSEKSRTQYAIRALLFDYLSLACIGCMSIILYLDELIYQRSLIFDWCVFSVPMIGIISTAFAIRGIVQGVRGNRNQEEYATTTIGFGVLQILVAVGLICSFLTVYRTAITG